MKRHAPVLVEGVAEFIQFVRTVVPTSELHGDYIRLPDPDTIRVAVAEYCHAQTGYEEWWEPEAIENAVRSTVGAAKYSVLWWLMDYADRLEAGTE